MSDDDLEHVEKAESEIERLESELTVWRAKFSSPEIVERELAELRALAEHRATLLDSVRENQRHLLSELQQTKTKLVTLAPLLDALWDVRALADERADDWGLKHEVRMVWWALRACKDALRDVILSPLSAGPAVDATDAEALARDIKSHGEPFGRPSWSDQVLALGQRLEQMQKHCRVIECKYGEEREENGDLSARLTRAERALDTAFSIEATHDDIRRRYVHDEPIRAALGLPARPAHEDLVRSMQEQTTPERPREATAARSDDGSLGASVGDFWARLTR